MARETQRRPDHNAIGLFLIFTAQGDVRLTRRYPSMSPNERCMFLTVNVPHSLFRVPELRGTITLNEVQTEPPTVDVAVAEQALSEALGARVELIVHHGE